MVKLSVEKIKVVFFSPTGGTKNAVELLVGLFDNENAFFDQTLPKQRKQLIACHKNDLLIVACPVYGGRIPKIEGLFENLAGDNTPAIIMTAYGNRHYDDAPAQLDMLLKSKGFNCVGAVMPIIPHTFSHKIADGRPDNQDMHMFEQFADMVSSRLAKGFVPIVVPGNGCPEPKPSKAMPRTFNKEACGGCMLCVNSCPVSAIDGATMEVDGSLCINCAKCQNVCPANAWKLEFAGATAFLESTCMTRRPVEIF